MDAISKYEQMTMYCIVISLVLMLVVLVFMLFQWTECLRVCSRLMKFLHCLVPFLTFVAGEVLLRKFFSKTPSPLLEFSPRFRSLKHKSQFHALYV